MNSNCSNSLDVRNLQEQVKKAFCYQKLFCSIDQEKLLKLKAEGREFAKLAGQNNFGNKIP